jgi:hypothetical protein
MFLRAINHCADWLATLADEADDGQERARGRWLLLVSASLVLAAGVVAVTAVITLGLDALLNAPL